MENLYLIGVENHLEQKKEYLDAIIDTGAKSVFIEETNFSWKNSCQSKLYDSIKNNGLILTPIYPMFFKFEASHEKIALLEFKYAKNIYKKIKKSNDSHCFLVGGFHLAPQEMESSLEFAIKLFDSSIGIITNNFFTDYPKNYETSIYERKKNIMKFF